MRELIRCNSAILMVLSRFDISLGFGDKTVADVCAENDVDAPTLLAVANLISGRDYSVSDISIDSLTGYLRRAHSYFLDFSLPAIRRKLLDSIDCSDADGLAFVVLRYFDDYVREVRAHMEYEDNTVFAYIDSLVSGDPKAAGFSISDFAEHHRPMESKLAELKDILIRYCPTRRRDMFNSVLFDIINCEQDLASHCAVEDTLLVPEVLELERQGLCRQSARRHGDDRQAAADAAAAPSVLSAREQQIVSLVARGISNKEIADRLCISVHTATTHRRNIVAKLDIHSQAGLTIYAIANHLVDLSEVKTV